MQFYVDDAPSGLSRMIEDGPQAVCWQGDEQCSFRSGGPCTAVPCTCETTGVCMSCPPRREPK